MRQDNICWTIEILADLDQLFANKVLVLWVAYGNAYAYLVHALALELKGDAGCTERKVGELTY